MTVKPLPVPDPAAAVAAYRAGARVPDIAAGQRVRVGVVYALLEREIPRPELRRLQSRNLAHGAAGRTANRGRPRPPAAPLVDVGPHGGKPAAGPPPRPRPADANPDRPTFVPGGTVAWVRAGRDGGGRRNPGGLPAGWVSAEGRWAARATAARAASREGAADDPGH